MTERKDLQAYPETNLSNQLLLHQQEMLQFLFFTNYDIIYETFQLKHGSYAQRNRGHIQQTFKSEEIARHFKMISEKMHLRILRDDIDLDKQLGKLQVLWHNRNIPYFHRYYFLKFLYTCYFKNIQPSIVREEEQIKSQGHIYFTLFKSINARQACLRHLKKQAAELSPQDVYEYLHTAKERLFNEKRKNQREKYKSQGYKLKMSEETFEGKMSKTKFEEFSDCFNHLTKLTLYVIELIVKWKEYIGEITHDNRKKKERMEYYFYDDNYYLKILTDFGFVKVSFLNQFYQFAPKNDPFMLECVLSFEKKKEKTVEHELLKQIFMPPKQHLAEILNKLELLSEQYRYNIRSRKVFDLNVLKKPLIRAEQKQFNNEAKEEISNLVLKKIESPKIQKKSKSVSTFRVREGSASRKGKIVVQFKNDSPSVKKKVPSLPGSIEKTVIDKEKDSPLKNSVITQKNESPIKIGSVDENLLNVLKQEIVKKVREEFDLHKGTKNHESQALQLFIDTKIKQTMKSVFPFEPEKQLKQPLEFTPLSVKDVNLSAEIEAMFKKSVPEYRQMQHNLVDLVKILEGTQYVYFLVGKIGDQEIGRVLCTIDKSIKQFKVLKVLYLHFCETSDIETLIIKFVEFLWQYENSFEVHYNFFQPANNDTIKALIQNLQNLLCKECIFGRKQLYSTVVEVKLIFKRQHKNVNFFPNKYPFSLHLDFSMLLASKKLMLENRNEHKHLELLNYDYFLMQAIKKLLSSQDILTLKQKITWRNRLKIIVQMLKEEEERDLMIDKLMQIQAGNISELNGILTKVKHPFLEVSDLVKSNHVTLLTTSFTFSPKFPVKTINHGINQRFYRLQINQKLRVRIDESGTEFFLLPTEESKDYQILVFDAKEYLNSIKEHEMSLNQYLTERISRQQHGLRMVDRVVNCLWVPMNRFPAKYKERQDVFTHTIRVLDLAPLKMDVLIGQKMEWLCNMEMENSIKFERHEADCMIDFPCGVGIVAADSKSIIYTRVFL